jgi:hypothetical protein
MRYLIPLLFVLASCSRSETAEPRPATTEAEATTEAAPPSAAESDQPPADEAPSVDAKVLEAPPSLELLDPGKGSRQKLRQDFKEGSKHTLSVHSEWTLDTAVFPVGGQMVMPELDYQLEALVKAVAEDGTAQFELRVVDVTAKSGKEVQANMKLLTAQAAAAMKGVKGRFSIGPRGLVGALDIPAPPKATPRFYEMIDQIDRALRLASLPLPEEPVGRGATWVVTQVVEHRGARIQQKATYELVSVKGSRMRAKVTFEQTAPVQRIRPPGGSLDIQLTELKFEGDGEGTWQLGKLAPRSASEKTVTVLAMDKRKPQPQIVLVGTTVTLKVREGR